MSQVCSSPLQLAAKEAGIQISPALAKAWNHRGPALQFYIQALLASKKITQVEYDFLFSANEPSAPPPPPGYLTTPPAPLSAPPSYDGLQTPPMGGGKATRKRATSLAQEQEVQLENEESIKDKLHSQETPKHRALELVHATHEKMTANASSPRSVQELMA
jgi:hypothetical protein